jgi:FKBP-type peptidyl-prolyl cis-trans isomerase FkpA
MIKPAAGIATVIAFFIIMSCKADDNKTTGAELKTSAEKFSYAMGMDVANALKKLESEIDLAAFLKGATDGFNGNEALLAPQEIMRVKKEIAVKEKEKQKLKRDALAQKNLKTGEAFLAEKRKEKDILSTDSGLLYRMLKNGKGKKPGIKDKVKIHYIITGINGTKFDDSVIRGNPAIVPVKGVIPGLSEALQLMPEGSKFKLFIPPQLAYGEKRAGPGGKIHPNSTLIFEVELLAVEKATEKS